jgi:hypothetical protein
MFSQIQQMAFASPPRADLYGTSSADNHQDHFDTALRAFGTADQILMAIGAIKVHLGVDGDLVFGFKMVAAIEGR